VHTTPIERFMPTNVDDYFTRSAGNPSTEPALTHR
jgi:hypothetical protein